MNLPNLNFAALVPEIILIVAAMVVLLVSLAVRDPKGRALGWLSFVAVLAALASIFLAAPGDVAFQSMALADGISRFLGAAVLIAAALAILLSIDRAADFTRWLGAYYALVLLATAGMRVMIIASDFLTIFIGLEILSLSLYVLVGFNRGDLRSGEAALKYFLLGAFASGFFLYGIALVYAATGTTSLSGLGQRLAPLSVSLPGVPLLPLGMGLLMVGFGFKLALVPFHMWTPDVYQGAPTAVTAFMSVATKTAAFAAFIRVLAAVVVHDRPWLLALAILAVLTMTLGNLAALQQASIKRMLAYSSIAHAGYVLTGLAAGNAQGAQGALYYLLAYTFMNIGAFAVVLAIQGRDENDVTNARLAGLASRRPGLAALMALFMFSLTGIPPLAGFFGKLYVFSAAVQANMAWLAVVAMLNSAIAAYYYLRVTVSMYMAEPTPEPGEQVAPAPATIAPARRPRPAVVAAAAAGSGSAPMPVIAGERMGAGSDGGHSDATRRSMAGNWPGETSPRALAGDYQGETRRGVRPPAGTPPTTWPIWAALGITALATIVLGIWQAPWVQMITQAVGTVVR